MNRPSKHLGPLSLGILLPSTSLVTRLTHSVFEFNSCHYALPTGQHIATSCHKPTSLLDWWPHFVLHPQTLTNTLVQITGHRQPQSTFASSPRRSRRPSSWPASSNLAIRYVSILVTGYLIATVYSAWWLSFAALDLAPTDRSLTLMQ
jgi:hypothetical protein